MSSSLSGLQPWLRPYAEALVAWFPNARVTSVYRSPSDQLRLYNNRANNPYPVAVPGTSYHEYGRAWDMVDTPENLALAGRWWRSIGGTWGGDFKSNPDPIHFQA